MEVFRFKKFDVVNERSAMKVNTDGVLLGAAMTITPQDRHLLDIGTGTGTIALMAAQRLTELLEKSSYSPHLQDEMRIDAIDIDGISAEEARHNFEMSPWNGIVKAHHASLNEYEAHISADIRFDLIFSNPPYFEDSLIAPDERKSTARHTSEGLSYRDILDFAARRLTSGGRVALVLPAEQEHDLTRHARMCDLHLRRILRERTVARKAPKRIIVEFIRRHVGGISQIPSLQDDTLIIQSEGKYTQEYLSLTHDFYLFA